MTSPTSGEPDDGWAGFPAPRADFSELLPGYALPPGFGTRPSEAPADSGFGPDVGAGVGTGPGWYAPGSRPPPTNPPTRPMPPISPMPSIGQMPPTWVGHPSGPISLGSPLDSTGGHRVVDGVVREVSDPFALDPLVPEAMTPPSFGPTTPVPYPTVPFAPGPEAPVVPGQPDPSSGALPVIYPGDRSRPPIYAPVQRAYGPGSQPRRGPRGARRTVSVDNNRCHLYAICQMEAPASFEVGRDGRLRYDMSPPGERLGEVRQAARLCPMQAIKVRED
ncbi:MAG: ferredoxin [Frankia sp.]